MTRLADPETLFKDGDWKITGIPGYEEMFDEVYHKCPWKKNFLFGVPITNLLKKWHCLSTHYLTTPDCAFCHDCGEEVPDSIIGVWKLKNFDLLQQQQNYNSAGWLGRPGQVWEYDPRQPPPFILTRLS